MRRSPLTILLALCTAFGCEARPQQRPFEPVRFEDGTVVVEQEAERMAEAWEAAKADPSHSLWNRIRRSDGSAAPELDYTGRTACGDDQAAQLFNQEELLVKRIVNQNDTLERLVHLNAFVRLELTGLPAGTDLESIDLIPVYGKWPERATFGEEAWSVTEGTLDKALPGAAVPASGRLVFWLAVPPVDLSGTAFALVARAADGRFWSARLSGAALKSGTAYRWNAACLSPEAPASGLKATPLSQTVLDVESGQYSGIAWLGADKYAVVDDKREGSGLLLFTVPIDAGGTIGTVSMSPAEGTSAAAGKSRDAEGVAYEPAGRTLYITSEKHQEIRAYDLSGHETGAALSVPEDLKGITRNLGFEALTFCGTTGLFWTTTEAPLKQDDFLPRLLRLQSFDLDGNPAGRYLYRTDEPSRSKENTLAYVFGVPALTALDDGRLLVLEREVYVPKGNLWDKLRNAFTDIRIYVVDPAGDPAGILRKSLLCSFTTGALNLANYEGMCLGPALPDGHRTLVLIADSQSGSGGLTLEYMKVILFR